MDAINFPAIQAIFAVTSISWVCSVSISLLALLFVSPRAFNHFVPELKSVVTLVALGLVTIHSITGIWLFL